MNYRRYALGTYARAKWVRCNECGTPEKPRYVWQGSDREVNMDIVFNAIVQHEVAAHLSHPAVKK